MLKKHYPRNPQDPGTTPETAVERAAKSEVQHDQSPVVWSRISNGLACELHGVYLGVKLTPDGWNDGYIDEAETPVPEAGIIFGVEQASYGYTGISAKPLPGFRVEALDIEASISEVTWRKTEEGQGEIDVTSDWGRLTEISDEEFFTANMGNTGGRAGIVRVTNATGEVKYYALGANFQGEPDSWRVTGTLVEVTPHEREALSGAAPELPAGE